MKQVDLTQGKVLPVLLGLAVPIMGSSLLQFTYNLVDMFWIGHLGSSSVASIGSSSFFTSLGYAIHTFIIVGTGIKTAQCMGKQDQRGVEGYIQAGMRMSLWVGLMYAAFLILWGRKLIGFLHLQESMVEKQAYQYLAWNAPVLFFAFFNQLFSRLFSSLGNSRSALKISGLGILFNIILDPLLIYGFKWGIQGAAIATLLSHIMVFFLYKKEGKELVKFKLSLSIDKKYRRDIIQLGIPSALQRILFTIINIMLARLIAKFGYHAVAAHKIGVQIESVTYMVTGGLNGAVTSFIGQNVGANKKERLYKGYWTAMTIGVIYAIISSVILGLGKELLAKCFVSEIGTIRSTASYLEIIAYSQIFNAIEMVSSGFFIGIGQPKIPAAVSIIFTALRLPIAFIAIPFLKVEGIWWSITLSTILKGSILLGLYIKNHLTCSKIIVLKKDKT